MIECLKATLRGDGGSSPTYPLQRPTRNKNQIKPYIIRLDWNYAREIPGSTRRATTDAQCARPCIYAKRYKSGMIHCLPQCEGITSDGELCLMTEQRLGMRF